MTKVFQVTTIVVLLLWSAANVYDWHTTKDGSNEDGQRWAMMKAEYAFDWYMPDGLVQAWCISGCDNPDGWGGSPQASGGYSEFPNRGSVSEVPCDAVVKIAPEVVLPVSGYDVVFKPIFSLEYQDQEFDFDTKYDTEYSGVCTLDVYGLDPLRVAN